MSIGYTEVQSANPAHCKGWEMPKPSRPKEGILATRQSSARLCLTGLDEVSRAFPQNIEIEKALKKRPIYLFSLNEG